jgi:hypothetical protein
MPSNRLSRGKREDLGFFQRRGFFTCLGGAKEEDVNEGDTKKARLM